MAQVNMVAFDFEREMLAIVNAINTIEAALGGIAELAAQMEDDMRAEVTGDKLDLFTTTLPRWITSAMPTLGLTDANVSGALTSLEVLEDEIRQLDESFRQDMEEVYTFDIEDLREQYSGKYGDREYLDPDDVAEVDEFFRRRDE
tara:strand:+ start:5507 stop:5941 length:435 start_codon:yes stop_codon:yes gene_type:complete